MGRSSLRRVALAQPPSHPASWGAQQAVHRRAAAAAAAAAAMMMMRRRSSPGADAVQAAGVGDAVVAERAVEHRRDVRDRAPQAAAGRGCLIQAHTLNTGRAAWVVAKGASTQRGCGRAGPRCAAAAHRVPGGCQQQVARGAEADARDAIAGRVLERVSQLLRHRRIVWRRLLWCPSARLSAPLPSLFKFGSAQHAEHAEYAPITRWGDRRERAQGEMASQEMAMARSPAAWRSALLTAAIAVAE